MFALSDARKYSFLKVPYLEGEEKITSQSNFVNDVTYFTSRSHARLKKWPTNGGKNSPKPSKLSRVETRKLTEILSRKLAYRPDQMQHYKTH